MYTVGSKRRPWVLVTLRGGGEGREGGSTVNAPSVARPSPRPLNYWSFLGSTPLRRWVGAKMAEWEEKEGGGAQSMRTIHHQSSPVRLQATLPLSPSVTWRTSYQSAVPTSLSLSYYFFLSSWLYLNTNHPLLVVSQHHHPTWTTFYSVPGQQQQRQQQQQHFFFPSSFGFSLFRYSVRFAAGFSGSSWIRSWCACWSTGSNGFHGNLKPFRCGACPARPDQRHTVLLVFIVVPFVLLNSDHKARGECQEHGPTVVTFSSSQPTTQITTTTTSIK